MQQKRRNYVHYTSKLGCAEGWKDWTTNSRGLAGWRLQVGLRRARATQTQIWVRFAFPHKPSNTCKRWRSAARWAPDNTQRHHCGTVRATSLKSRRTLEQHAHRHCAPACAPSCWNPRHYTYSIKKKASARGKCHARTNLLLDSQPHLVRSDFL